VEPVGPVEGEDGDAVVDRLQQVLRHGDPPGPRVRRWYHRPAAPAGRRTRRGGLVLERVDRVQLAVRDRWQAAKTFGRLLGASIVRDEASAHLGARRAVLALGESEVELCEPSGPGPARAHLERWGEGLLTAGFAVADAADARARLARAGVVFVADG